MLLIVVPVLNDIRLWYFIFYIWLWYSRSDTVYKAEFIVVESRYNIMRFINIRAITFYNIILLLLQILYFISYNICIYTDLQLLDEFMDLCTVNV